MTLGPGDVFVVLLTLVVFVMFWSFVARVVLSMLRLVIHWVVRVGKEVQ